MCLSTRGLVFTPLREHYALGSCWEKGSPTLPGTHREPKAWRSDGGIEDHPLRVSVGAVQLPLSSQRGDAPGIPAHSLFCLGAGTSMRTHTPGDDPVAYCGAWCHSRHPGAPKTSRWGKETSPRDCLSLASSFCSRRASMMAPGTCIQAMGLFTQKAPEID